MGIVRFALRFPHTFYVVAALILFLGIAAITRMPTDIFPEIRIPVVTVIWSYTGLSTPEMEQRVSTYSQYSISANVNGIKNMESQTLNGLSVQKIYQRLYRETLRRYRRSDESGSVAGRDRRARTGPPDRAGPRRPWGRPTAPLSRRRRAVNSPRSPTRAAAVSSSRDG